MIDLVLFDLDGTLIDTKEDLARSVNALRARLGREPVSVERAVRWVGDGARILVARALGVPEERAREEPEVAAGLAFFREHYVAHMLDHAHPYPGVPEGLRTLAEGGRTLAVLSNKPEAMCVEMLEQLGLGGLFLEIVGGDRLPVRKPDPAPVLLALEVAGVPPERAMMVGDGVQDMRAGRAAGCVTVAALYGFRPRALLEAEKPDHRIERFEELLDLLPVPGPTEGGIS